MAEVILLLGIERVKAWIFSLEIVAVATGRGDNGSEGDVALRTFSAKLEARACPAETSGLEARGRIELPHKGFADLSLTTWVPRRNEFSVVSSQLSVKPSTATEY